MSSEAPVQLRLGPESAGMLLTPEEFDEVTDYDERYRYELVHGVLVVNPIPSEADASPNDELGFLLREYQNRHPQGLALDETLPERYVRTAGSRRRADRVIWSGLGRRPDPGTDVPTIVVEFVSAGKRDRQRDYDEKRREYLAVGVQEYWVVDRFRRQMTVYHNRPAAPEGFEQQRVSEQDSYRTALLPGFELRLARLLAVADKWSDESRDG